MTFFWASILVGTLFGFIGSVVANLIHNPLLVLADKWRLSSKRKRFKREMQFHHFLTDLKSGKIDKHVYVVRICATMVMSFLSFLICTAVGVVLAYTSQRADARIPGYIFGVASGGFLSFYFIAASRYQALVYGLENFAKVDAEYKEKWAAQLASCDSPALSESFSSKV